jgi:hypothetical protein
VEEERRCIASHAAESDYAPLARAMLWKLGYALVPATEAASPELRVVREDRLDEVPPEAREPILLLAGARRHAARDPRVRGTVGRPAGVHELYRLIQRALHERPRFVPRVETAIQALARRNGEAWPLELRSLSENGCLASGPALPALGTSLRLEIRLPHGSGLVIPATTTYEQGESVGLVFDGMKLAERRVLASTVLELLASA